jgi:hypothetical protein
MKLNILTLVIALLGLSFLGIHYGSKPWTPTRIAGGLIGLPSLALVVLARIELGSSFTVLTHWMTWRIVPRKSESQRNQVLSRTCPVSAARRLPSFTGPPNRSL